MYHHNPYVCIIINMKLSPFTKNKSSVERSFFCLKSIYSIHTDYGEMYIPFFPFLCIVGCSIILGVTIVVPICMIVMGSIYLHECPQGEYIPVYLLVGGNYAITLFII